MELIYQNIEEIKKFIRQNLKGSFTIFWDKESYKLLTSITNTTHGIITCHSDIPNARLYVLYNIIFNKNTIIIILGVNYGVDAITKLEFSYEIYIPVFMKKQLNIDNDHLIINEDSILIDDKLKSYIKYGIVMNDPNVNLDQLIDLLIWI